jgi:hypothetical protein
MCLLRLNADVARDLAPLGELGGDEAAELRRLMRTASAPSSPCASPFSFDTSTSRSRHTAIDDRRGVCAGTSSPHQFCDS